MADRRTHFELDPKATRVACGMRKVGMMGMNGASYWLKETDLQVPDRHPVTCTRCQEVITNRRAKGLPLTKGN